MELAFLKQDMKKKCKISIVVLLFFCISAFAQQEKENNDTFPRPIPDFLSPELFIPKNRLLGFQPWTFAPLPRPEGNLRVQRLCLFQGSQESCSHRYGSARG